MGGMERLCFIFPNRRALTFFKKYLGECVAASRTPVLAPRLFTMNDFFYQAAAASQTDQVHLLLVQATQSDMAKAHYGTSAELMLIDLDSDTLITCTNVVWPETSELTSKEDLLNMLFSCWDSYLLGYNPHVYFDAEIIFPLSAEEIDAINTALSAYFTKPE